MMNAQDIKKGTAIRMDGKIFVCVDFLHVKPGKGNTFMRTKLKNVVDGGTIDKRFNIGEKLEEVRVEHRAYQYLYKESDEILIFMNNETYEQIPIQPSLINGIEFLSDNMECEVVVDANEETVLYVELPTKIIQEVTYTEPGIKGDTATNTLKPAKVECGAEVNVPLFINTGDKIEIDTRDGSYVGRA